MYDFSVPNSEPGPCAKCKGTGLYRWGGAMVNGAWKGKSGPCHSCQGTGKQSAKQIRRNQAYNRHKLNTIGI